MLLTVSVENALQPFPGANGIAPGGQRACKQLGSEHSLATEAWSLQCDSSSRSLPELAAGICRQVKERQAEDHLFGDKEKFVTAAYKKELQERQLWEARQKLK